MVENFNIILASVCKVCNIIFSISNPTCADGEWMHEVIRRE
jgi:hypothetical protein